MDHSLKDLRAADLVTFVAVHRARSVTAAARALGVTPSQVSKAVARLERSLKLKLLVRGPRGVTISEAGRELVPKLDELISRIKGLRDSSAKASAELTIAAPSFLHGPFATAIAVGLPNHRLRCLSMAPMLARAYSSERIFHAAVTVGRERFHERWVETELGEMRCELFATPALAARLGGRRIGVAALREIPFVSPISLVNGQALPAEDGCPLRREHRRLGQEVETIVIGLELASRSDQVVYGPVLAARTYLDDKRLVEVEVAEWRQRPAPMLYLYCDSDHMLARVQRALVERCTAALAD